MVFNDLPFKGDIMYLMQNKTQCCFIYAFLNVNFIIKICLLIQAFDF